MEQKVKLIIIALVALLVVTIFMNFRTLGLKQLLERQSDALKNENNTLVEKFNKMSKEFQSLVKRTESLGEELDKASKEKEELQGKYNLLEKTRKDLVERMKTLKTKTEVKPPPSVAPVPTDVYWVKVLKEKMTLGMQLENLRSDFKKIQADNEDAQREKANLEAEIKNLNLEKQDLNRQLEYNQKQAAYNQKALDSVISELVAEKNGKSQINDALKAIKNENNILKQQLKSLSKRKLNLEKKIDELDILLKDKMIQADTLNKQLISGKTDEVRSEESSSVELPAIVVRPQQAGLAAQRQSSLCKIMAINKDNNFVIIDLGKDSGIRLGEIFKVYRDDDAIATIEVMQVRKTISACDIKKEAKPIKVGDIVK
ncbi:MAG: hypothetical protein WBI28_04795 [Candidatus Omnitrophota bacterium]